MARSAAAVMTYYDILEVSPSASKEVVRAAYKSLMQRDHPDKHPTDSAMASRTALVAQAYAVLSDVAQRAAYDAQLQAPRAVRTPPPAAPQARPRHRAAAPTPAANGYLWMLAIVTLAAGGLVFALSGKKPPAAPVALAVRLPEPAPLQPIQPMQPEPPNTAPAATPGIRQIALLTSDLRVALAPSEGWADSAQTQPHQLLIPALTVDIGSIESDTFANALLHNQEAVVQKLADTLAHASYAELKTQGEAYLGPFITQALREITGTQGLDDQAAPRSADTKRYGVLAVALPAAFSLR